MGRSDEDILSVLVHEMVHVWQQHFSMPPRGGYHDKKWGSKMEEIGLMPSNTGQPGGKKTGQQMHHYIIPGGPFDLSYLLWFEAGNKLLWNSQIEEENKNKKPNSKIKYTCPDCEQNAWAKPNAHLVCGHCDLTMMEE